MTPETALELEFADGVYTFALKLPQMQELQEKRGIGIFAVYARVLQGRYLLDGLTIGATNEAEAYYEDLAETIRLGLIGGGRGMVDEREIEVTALTAKRLVERYVLDAPLRDAWALAAAILGARIEGYDPPKKAEPAHEPATSTSPPTSEELSQTAPLSASTGGN